MSASSGKQGQTDQRAPGGLDMIADATRYGAKMNMYNETIASVLASSERIIPQVSPVVRDVIDMVTWRVLIGFTAYYFFAMLENLALYVS